MFNFKKTLIVSITLFFVVLFTPNTFAANVSMESVTETGLGSSFSVDIMALTDGQPINSVDITVDYREDLVSFSGYKKDGTVVGLWVTPPYEKDGKIYMSGIIPGGVSGLYDVNKSELSGIPITRLLFTAKKEGIADFFFVKTQLLKHDGQGTLLEHDQSGVEVSIKKDINTEISTTLKENISDDLSPNTFTIDFVESSFFSKTPSMIVFNAEDEGSGIKEYKIKIGLSNWKTTQNPQPIGKSIFSKNVSVRAYDFYGNFKDANIMIPGLLSTRIILLILGILLSSILVYKLLKYRV